MEGTAIIQIKPGGEQAVKALHEQALGLLRFADARVIQGDEDVKPATDDLSIISGLKKAIEEKRKEYISPIKQHLDDVNEFFKGLTDPLVQADKITRIKILDYRAEQERIRQEQERINLMRIEVAKAEMDLKGELTESVELIETQPEPPKHYQAEAGTLGTAKIKKWEVADFSQVPNEYKMIDSAKVGKVVRAGIPSIPGIRIWEETSLRVTPKEE